MRSGPEGGVEASAALFSVWHVWRYWLLHSRQAEVALVLVSNLGNRCSRVLRPACWSIRVTGVTDRAQVAVERILEVRALVALHRLPLDLERLIRRHVVPAKFARKVT